MDIRGTNSDYKMDKNLPIFTLKKSFICVYYIQDYISIMYIYILALVVLLFQGQFIA